MSGRSAGANGLRIFAEVPAPAMGTCWATVTSFDVRHDRLTRRRPREAARVLPHRGEELAAARGAACGADIRMGGSPAHPAEMTRRLTNRREKLAATEHALELGAALVLAERLDTRVRRVAGHLLDAEVAVGGGRGIPAGGGAWGGA